jgi:outer membrane protein|tara:strand:+ start:1168 stop:1695 length:528 start_codon:yes stop_codon:yes gene_type:complete
MPKFIKFITILTIIFSFSIQNTLADIPYFIDFKKVLNESTAGKNAQTFLKNKLEKESKKFKETESNLRKEEQDLINKKKIISNEEFQKKVTQLREKVAKLQKDKNKSFNDIGKLRTSAKTQLLKALNPILKTYMEKNNIRLILDKSSILLGDTKLDITTQVIEILNKELKSLNLK